MRFLILCIRKRAAKSVTGFSLVKHVLRDSFPVAAILIGALVFNALAQNDAGTGISEKPVPKDATQKTTKKDTAGLAPSFTHDTVAPGHFSDTMGPPKNSGSITDTITLGSGPRAARPTAALANLESTFRAGKALTTVGLILHASGLGFTFLGSGIESSDGTAQAVSSVIGSTMMYIGPIFSCVGATKVEHGLRDAGFEAENPRVWAEYGWGWLCQAGCLGLAAGAIATLVQSSQASDQSPPALPILMLVGAVACEVIGEVEWMKCVIHARTYVSRMEKKTHAYHANISVMPYYSLSGAAGARVGMGL